jgi:hypothetical protein
MNRPSAPTKSLRSQYAAIWSREWPHDDSYLVELWAECQSTPPKRGRNARPIYDETLMRMRENHQFEDPH